MHCGGRGLEFPAGEEDIAEAKNYALDTMQSFRGERKRSFYYDYEKVTYKGYACKVIQRPVEAQQKGKLTN